MAPLKEHGLPLSYALGILGMPARTAYFGLLEAGKVQAGETLVVSGAAGAVGCIVVQIAKLKGMRVVAIAGSAEKLAWLQGELGADAVIDYTQHDSQEVMHQALQAACPDGVDVYWDNVGGYITDAVLELINVRARVIICGQITQYNGGLDAPAPGPRFLHRLIYTRATIQGILARDYNHRMPEMLAQITEWLTSGQIKYKETIWEGFDRLPDALNALFHSKNTGKMIVKIAE
ncbi:MAG: NADP-dependent oxidoreductase [archaeon]|nr:NADP-dependent oxidoreductase [archaeon]